MSKPKILVVDDDAMLRDLMAEALEDCTVVTATNGANGLQKYRDEGSFEAVVTDLEMPGGNGPDMIQAIRALTPTQPCLLVSGNPMLLAEAGSKLGVPTMGKPFKSIMLFIEEVQRLANNGRPVRT